MFAKSNIRPRVNCSLGLEVHTNCFLKNKNMKNKAITTVKKYLAHTICKTGKSELRCFAIPSITGKIAQANRL